MWTKLRFEISKKKMHKFPPILEHLHITADRKMPGQKALKRICFLKIRQNDAHKAMMKRASS